MSASVTPPAPAAPAMSLGGRVINTFIAPSSAFAEIKRSPAWWLPWLLLAIGSVIFVTGIQTKIGFEQVQQNTFRMSPKAQERMEQMPADQRARALQINEKIIAGTAWSFPLLRLIGWVILAAILMATFNFGMGAEVSFGKSLAVTAWGTLPEIFRSLLAAILIFTGKIDPEGFNLQNPVGTNLGYYLDPGKSKFLFTLGSGLDIFIIWSLIITGIGYASVSKLKSGTAIAIVVGWWVFFLLVGAAFSLLG